MVVLHGFSHPAAPKAGHWRRNASRTPYACCPTRDTHGMIFVAPQELIEGFHPGLVHPSTIMLTRRPSRSHIDSQCELLAPFVHNVDAIYATFLKYRSFSSRAPQNVCSQVCFSYKLTVPTFGCALIDPTRSAVLLVKGFGRNRFACLLSFSLVFFVTGASCVTRALLQFMGVS